MQLFTVPLLCALLAAVALSNENEDFEEEEVDEFGARLVGPVANVTNNVTAPYVVHLAAFRSDGSQINSCGGTILNHTIILTSARCVYGANHVEVHAGNIDSSAPTQTITGVPVWHKDYGKNSHENDIAVVILKRGLNYNTQVQPVTYPKKSDVGKDKFAGKTVTVYGWGWYNLTEASDSQVLQMLNIPVPKNDDCKKAMRKAWYLLPTTSFCGNGTQSQGMCKHDLGGPIMYTDSKAKPPKTFLVGLMSQYIDCPSKVPNVFTAIHNFLDWIMQKGGPKAA